MKKRDGTLLIIDAQVGAFDSEKITTLFNGRKILKNTKGWSITDEKNFIPFTSVKTVAILVVRFRKIPTVGKFILKIYQL